MAPDAQGDGGAGLRPADVVVLVGVGLVGLVVAFWVLGHILGIVWFLVKVAAVVAVVVAALALLVRRRR